MKSLYLLIVSLLIINHNLTSKEMRNPKIAITKASGSKSYENYRNWILRANPNIEIIDLIDMEVSKIDSIVKTVDGLLLSGGPDIDPIHFDKVEERDRCSIDLRRDSIEITAINSAKQINLPILGICRGLQLLNVVYGGSLFTDIPTDVPNHSNHQQKNGDTYHSINIKQNSILKDLVKSDTITVNSSHHQSIDKLAKDFTITSTTPDNVVESIEYNNKNHWVFAVQWHPERLEFESSASGKIAFLFLDEVKKYMQSKTK